MLSLIVARTIFDEFFLRLRSPFAFSQLRSARLNMHAEIVSSTVCIMVSASSSDTLSTSYSMYFKYAYFVCLKQSKAGRRMASRGVETVRSGGVSLGSDHHGVRVSADVATYTTSLPLTARLIRMNFILDGKNV